jgi:hypothetical protein
MILSWDTKALAKLDVVELQIWRDAGTAGPNAPFCVISNPVAIAQGYVDLTSIYADGAYWEPAGHTVNYSVIDASGKNLVSMAYEWQPEGYGFSHTYTLCAIVAKQKGKKCSYSYDYSDFPAPVTMTCVEPVTADWDHIVSPGMYESVLVSDIRDGMTNLMWRSSGGATEYVVTVQPVDPTIGGVWHSSIVYHYTGPWSDGWTLSLSESDRLALAAWLSSPGFAFNDIMWRVDARNAEDPAPYWTLGDWNVFSIMGTPPGPPM